MQQENDEPSIPHEKVNVVFDRFPNELIPDEPTSSSVDESDKTVYNE